MNKQLVNNKLKSSRLKSEPSLIHGIFCLVNEVVYIVTSKVFHCTLKLITHARDFTVDMQARLRSYW